MSVLILAEHDNDLYKLNLLHVVTAASQLSDEIDVLVVGHECKVVAEDVSKLATLRRVVLVDDKCYQHQLAENVAKLVAMLASDYEYILAAASSYGKNIMPRLAALLDVAQISDITEIIDNTHFIRPIYAGNALETVQTHDTKKVITVRSTAFPAIGLSESPCEISYIDKSISWEKTRFLKYDLTESERPELTTAKVVIAGGRGMQSGENFKLLEQLADKLDAAIGASRAAVDAGYVPNDYQIGQTGKVVAPELYIAVGISGAVQHIAGMKESKIIVAINKDEDAPIFNYADYGLVGDLFEIIPELIDNI